MSDECRGVNKDLLTIHFTHLLLCDDVQVKYAV